MPNFKEAPALKKMPRLGAAPDAGQFGDLSIDDVIRALGGGAILAGPYPEEMGSGTGAAASALEQDPEMVRQSPTAMDMPMPAGAQTGQKRERTPFEKLITGEPQSQDPSIASDMTKSFGSGVVRGATELVMLPATIKRLGNQGAEYVVNQGDSLVRSIFGLPPMSDEWRAKVQKGKDESWSTKMDNAIFSGQDTVRGVMNDYLYAPRTTPGEYAKTAGEFVPGALAGGGNLLTNVVRYGVVPGVASEAAGQATEGTKLEPYARLVGALLGSAGGRLITPLPVSAERQMMNQTLRNEGIYLSGGQASDSINLRNVEGDLGGTAAQGFNQMQGDQFTHAALSRAGIDADRATPEIMQQAFTRIGDDLDAAAANNSLIPDQQFANEVTAAMGAYNRVVGEGARAPVVRDSILDYARLVKGGHQGDTYKAIRSRLEDARAESANDPKLLKALSGIRNAMDDAMERSIAAQNPNSLNAWQEAKRQYRNFLDLEKAVAAAGENAPKGIISPSHLRGATIPQSPRAFAQEGGDFTALAKAGEEVMKPLSSSSRSPVRNLFQGIPAAVSAVVGDRLAGGTGATGAILGTLMGTAAPYAAGRVLLSPPVRAYLANQLIQPARLTNPGVAALAQALLSQQAAQGQQQPTR
ncbi:hypothetical protein [Rhizobium leguminosarum]|uniref:hypothetical protein n=1 Tax=Rhizobium leguminosarum TaxID=384 RepID=UPI001C91E129|nr:hypothetical protein [Rhizobium leguminosarum]MBY2917484.1 hypothetical protein [Rhizobium leguminosarum]MBY2974212.1 hypothetical protein [Rhizobium leguminosarum]MBY2981612.1 hypothetical protein [Rhizobium leguminosarum]MBY3010161.1 hypothetical protein [Rhizobium leguminosarum]